MITNNKKAAMQFTGPVIVTMIIALLFVFLLFSLASAKIPALARSVIPEKKCDTGFSLGDYKEEINKMLDRGDNAFAIKKYQEFEECFPEEKQSTSQKKETEEIKEYFYNAYKDYIVDANSKGNTTLVISLYDQLPASLKNDEKVGKKFLEVVGANYLVEANKRKGFIAFKDGSKQEVTTEEIDKAVEDYNKVQEMNSNLWQQANDGKIYVTSCKRRGGQCKADIFGLTNYRHLNGPSTGFSDCLGLKYCVILNQAP